MGLWDVDSKFGIVAVQHRGGTRRRIVAAARALSISGDVCRAG
jgi:hypothetical protein